MAHTEARELVAPLRVNPHGVHQLTRDEIAVEQACLVGVRVCYRLACLPHRTLIFSRRVKKMKATLKPGITYEHKFLIPPSKTVPALYPEADEFVAMPEVFATGFMVGFLEWACIKAINPHLDWPSEQSLGTHSDVSHEAATPPGLEVTAKVKLVEVSARRLLFEIEAHDGHDLICKGRHERFVIDRAKFEAKLEQKRARNLSKM